MNNGTTVDKVLSAVYKQTGTYRAGRVHLKNIIIELAYTVHLDFKYTVSILDF